MMDTDKFIMLVRERRFIYKKKSNNLLSRRKVAKAWLEIARLMGTGNGKQWATKWKSLRDCYTKFKKSIDTDSPSAEACKKYKNWPWAEQMKFLDHDASKQTDSNMDGETETNSNNMTSEDSDAGNFSNPGTINSVYPQNSGPDFYSCPPGISKNSGHFEDSANDISFETVMVMNNANGPGNKLNAQEGDLVEKQMLKYLQENNLNNKTMDDIDHLFASYATSLKKMPVRMQSMIKLDIATLFAKYELEVQDQNNTKIKYELVESE